jgi:methionyl-tRNA formyltransferase
VNEYVPYPYASGDRLEQRNTYFYTPYFGIAFLEAWRQQRAQALRELAAAPSSALGGSEAAPGWHATDRLLESIYRDLSAGDLPDNDSLRTLNRLLQRFEVSKRLHGAYDANWRATDVSDYRSMDRYLRFGEILVLAYGRAGALPYLSALLKIVDTLTSRLETLDAPQRTRLAEVIVRERDYVDRLAARLGALTHAA